MSAKTTEQPATKEVTMESVLAEMRHVRQNISQNKETVRNKKSDRHYAWINQNTERVSMMKHLGYKTTDDPGIESEYKQADNTHRWGDLILMDIGKVYYEALNFLDEESSTEAEEGTEGEFKDWADNNSIEVFEAR